MIPRQIIEQSLRLEFANQKRLVDTLLRARSELAPALESSPNLRELDRRMDSITQAIQKARTLDATAYQTGLEQGKVLVATSSGARVGSSFDLFVPYFNPEVLGMLQSRSTDLITNMAQDLKERVMKEVQLSYALGEGTTQTMARVLGTGLSGSYGRDGVFRGSRFRAEAIARTTMNEFQNFGAMGTYEQVKEAYPSLGLRKEWVTTSDRRTSDICTSLIGQVKELEQPFQGLGWSGQYPPAHPFCRSRVVANTGQWSQVTERTPTPQVQHPQVKEALRNER